MGSFDDAILESQDYPDVGERIGLALIAVVGILSAISTFSLLCYIIWHGFLVGASTRSCVSNGVRLFCRSALGAYLISLLLSDFFQGAAFAANFRWAAVGSMHVGGVCTFQGALSQVGDLGSAVWSFAIACHTFSILFYTRRPASWTAPVVLLAGWTALVIFPVLGTTAIQDYDRHGSFWSLSGAWCFIGGGYQVARLLYLWVWILTALFLSTILYTLIYLRFSRILSVEGSRIAWKGLPSGSLSCLKPWSVWNLSSHDGKSTGRSRSAGSRERATGSGEGSDVQVGEHVKQVAMKLLLYPLVYFIVIVPVCICRLGVMAGWTPPFGLYVFAGICFSSSGLTNVLLYTITRHALIQNVASRSRITVTTHQMTVIDDGEPSAWIRPPRWDERVRAEMDGKDVGGDQSKVDLNIIEFPGTGSMFAEEVDDDHVAKFDADCLASKRELVQHQSSERLLQQ